MRRATRSLTAEEQRFLEIARGKFLQNTDWFEFEDFAFGSRSPLFAATRSHRDVLTHPLYLALKDMWLQLGVRQGRVAPSGNEESEHAARRETRGRR